MAAWRFTITLSAQRLVKKLDKETKVQVADKIEWLVYHFDEVNHIPFHQSLDGFFKLRVGNWRVVYEAEYDKLLITVHDVDHRSKIYKKYK
ncbi:MAG TPA: type II toxin-antitoxin system RelE/ParE family toxin [Candidatus Paceibacterota bacterium]